MTTVADIYNFLDQQSPFRLQESYDNAGIIVGDPDTIVSGVLCCLDSTEDIVKEAVSLGANVIIAHHPIVFKGLKTLTGKNYVERTIISAIKNNIAIIASHTNLDNVVDVGVNKKISDIIGLHDTEPLLPKMDDSIVDRPIGSGIIGRIEEMKEIDFMHHLKECMQLKVIKHTPLLGRPISKVAICGGAGQFLLSQAIRMGADIFITGDVKYHEFFDAENHLILTDIGHYESEKFTIDLLYEMITLNFSNFAAHKTELNTNPVNYL